MISKILPVLVLSILTVACASKKNGTLENTSTSNETMNNNHQTEHQAIFQDVAPGDSLFAYIRKGYCFGTCPVFEIKIFNSGYVVYEGIQNVSRMGIYTTHLQKEELLKFIEKANEIHYFDMQDVYDNEHITDLPETTTSIVINGERKQVKRRYGFPNALVAFETLFSDLIDSKQWAGNGIDK